MAEILPIALDRVLHCRGVESQRIEFKSIWDARTIGPQVLKTICAFANDYHNLNGGYIVLGVAARDRRAVLPPTGLSDEALEAAQQWIRGNCSRLAPTYQPVLSPETIEGRRVLVVWAPASEVRPHRAPDARGGPARYWVRIGAETVDAELRGDLLRGLMQQAARVPWDDRRALEAKVEDLSETRVREHLRDVGSGLLREADSRDIYQRMRLIVKVDGHEAPRNVGVLFFAREPSRWFRGARIEVVQFAADRAGDVREERAFVGPLPDQVRSCLNYLEGISGVHLQKQADRPQMQGWVSYPLMALRETLVNAVYHRGYDVDQPEPTKVYLYPDRVEVISYPGPVPGIEAGQLTPNAQVRAAPARNRRIGEFLKELGLAEGRLSGLPKVFQTMEANGSPLPRFEFDEQRTYFQATLPAHPEYAALSAIRDAAHLRALGSDSEALRRIETAWMGNQGSAALAVELIRAYGSQGEIQRAEQALEAFEECGAGSGVPHVANALAAAFVEAGEGRKARHVLLKAHPATYGRDAIDAAILARRLRDWKLAHRHFERAGDAVQADPRALLEFAQTKIRLAQEAHGQRQRSLERRILAEARGLLERVIQLPASPARHAWAWRELARVRHWLRAPFRDVEAAYREAMERLPREPRFAEELGKLRRSQKQG